MIEIDYSKGNIHINTRDLSLAYNENQLPLTFEIKNTVSKEVVWKTTLNSNMWAVYPTNEINDVIVKDVNGNFIHRHHWDVIQHGSIFYKGLYLYCKNILNSGRTPKGLVIGTHDGEFGEWVPIARQYMSDMVLIEASDKQYQKLEQNYRGNTNVRTIQSLITTDGKDVEFFEGGKGYTNTVVKRVIDYWEKEEVRSTMKPSVSINQIIDGYFNNGLDWLHLDVEGLDAQLIMSIQENKLPNFIIFEDFNLNDEDKVIYNFLEKKGFKLHSQDGICMAKKS